jgi:ATP/maltotriose-dependent transcriptional regulator MalT
LIRVSSTVVRGRAAFDRGAWTEACELLAECCDVDDIERLALAAHLAGRDDDSERAWARAHRERLRLGHTDAAVRCAFWLAISLMLRGETARAGGWLAGAERLVDQAGSGRGYLRVPAFLGALADGDGAAAEAIANEVVEVAQRCGDEDLRALGVLGQGQAALVLGELGRAMDLLDEVMVLVTATPRSPIVTGIVYCAVIEACMDAADVRRAAEWTQALERWCAAQPDLVPYRGQCLVHRAQVLQARGSWPDALAEAERACRRLADPPHPALGLALYQQAELHRLRGELDAAERAYRAAGRAGREPAPGFALLRLAQGDVAAASAAVRRLVEESRGRIDRPVLLAAAVEVHLAAGDPAAAAEASRELAAIADRPDTPPLRRAVADHARGAVLLAEGAAGEALPLLRAAAGRWRALSMPYDVARAGVRVALACRALGDEDAARLELEAACAAFAQLGARPDLAAATALAAAPTVGRAGLTARECEVLRLVASGRTNREIAAELVISEHTVARHLQNMFAKLDLPSRAAATAYAYRHGVV